MIVPVEIVLRGRDTAVTESVVVPHGEPSAWDDRAVRDLLVGVLRAIDRAENPSASPDRTVVLQGFSWIVEPLDDKVVVAIEIPMGAAVAGPIAIGQAELDQMITRVLRSERRTPRPETIH
jgi:hypothetical protein